MAAQRQLGVSEKSVRYWRSQKAKLCACNPRNRSFRGRQAVHPELENKVADFVRELRSRSLRRPCADRLRELYNEWIAGDNKKTYTGRLRPCQAGCPSLGSRCPTTWLHERSGSAPSATRLMAWKMTVRSSHPRTTLRARTSDFGRHSEWQ